MFKIETETDTLPQEQCPHPIFEAFEIIENSWSGDSFIDVKIVGPVTFVILNKRHDFYKKIYLRASESKKSQEFEALEFLLISYARARNDAMVKNYDLQK